MAKSALFISEDGQMKVLNKNLPGGLKLAGLSLLLLAGLNGCQTKQEDSAALLATNDYRVRHPIVIAEKPEILDLPIGYQTRGLNRNIAGSVTEFAVRSRQNGNGRVEIQVPSGAANESAVHSVTPQIKSALKRGGVGARHITTRSYAPEDTGAAAPIRLSYARVQASVDECGEWPSSIDGKFGPNHDYQNFGCASQHNLAAMVENPADLLTPRASTPVDQQRRAVLFEKYRAGEITGSEYKEGVGAAIAD